MASWVYKALQRHYVNVETGRAIGDDDLIRLRDQYTQQKARSIADLTTRLADQNITLNAYEREMRQTLRVMHLTEYSLGRGGAGAMTARDYGSVGRALKDQYAYLRGFVNDAAEGNLTGPQMLARAELYGGAATASFERGRARAWGANLPAYPGDGGTECLGNCRCSWAYESKSDEELHAIWRVGGSDPCDGCQRRAQEYAPYIIRFA